MMRLAAGSRKLPPAGEVGTKSVKLSALVLTINRVSYCRWEGISTLRLTDGPESARLLTADRINE